MKRLYTLFFGTLLLFNPSVLLAQESSTAKKKKETEMFLGHMMDNYAIIAVGWHMNRRCSILDKEQSAEFDWYVEKLNLTMGKLVRNINFLKQIQQSARKTSENEAYQDCSGEAQNVVRETFDLARELVTQLTQEKYVKGVSDIQSLTSRYVYISMGFQAMSRCRSLSENLAGDVESTYHKVSRQFSEKYKDAALQAQKIIQENEEKVNNRDCKQVRPMVHDVLREMRQLEAQLSG